MKPLRFDLPMPPNLANGRMHHMVKHRRKVAYWDQLDMCRLAGTFSPYVVPKPPEIPFARASIRSVMYVGNPMDDGNAMNRHKWIEDWLVTRGYLVDDAKKHLTWEGLPTQVVKRDGNYRIELTLTPLSEDTAHAA